MIRIEIQIFYFSKNSKKMNLPFSFPTDISFCVKDWNLNLNLLDRSSTESEE